MQAEHRSRRRKGGAVDEAAAARVLAVLAALWRKLPAPATDGATDVGAQPQQLMQQVWLSACNCQCSTNNPLFVLSSCTA
jgi:hypothetical protein